MNRISIKTEKEIETLRESARLLVEAFRAVERILKSGVITKELNDCAVQVIQSGGGEPAFRGYQGYPGEICVSINEQVVHGLPGKRKVKIGDLVKVDMGVIWNGYYTDAAKTYAIGSISDDQSRLMSATREAMHKGIRQCKKGNRVSDISHAIQFFVESKGFSVVRNLVGHGIGRALHEEPQIPNFGPPHRGALLKAGMVLAVETMVNMGSYEVQTLEDGWTVTTSDGFPSAHFEHTILITEGMPEIFTIGLEHNGGENTHG